MVGKTAVATYSARKNNGSNDLRRAHAGTQGGRGEVKGAAKQSPVPLEKRRNGQRQKGCPRKSERKITKQKDYGAMTAKKKMKGKNR